MAIEFHRDGPWDLPKGWEWARASDFAYVVGGGTPKNASDENNFDPSGTPWITPADLSGYSASYIDRGARSLSVEGMANSSARRLPQGSLLISSRAPIGYCVVASNEVTTNQGFKSLVFRIPVCPEFFRYYVIYNRRYFVDSASGTTFKELSGEAMSGLLFPIAPFEEQRRIVARIDELFTEIADGEASLTRAHNDLDTWRRALLKAAVTGELTRGWRENVCFGETGSDLLARARSLSKAQSGNPPSQTSDEFDFAPTVELPSNWAWANFDDLAESLGDGGLKLRRSAYARSGRFPVVDQSEQFVGGYTDRQDLLFPVAPPLILFGDHTRRFKYIEFPFVLGADGVKVIRPKDCIFPKFLWLALRNSHFLDRGYSRHFQFVRSLRLPVPPLSEQREIVARFEAAEIEISNVESSLSAENAIGGLRQAALKAAFEGRLVEQDLHDEPAERLLTRVNESHQVTTQSGRATRRAALPHSTSSSR